MLAISGAAWVSGLAGDGIRQVPSTTSISLCSTINRNPGCKQAFDFSPLPFSTRCIARSTISPLEPGEECEHEMFVLIRWKRRQLAVPLMQLEGIGVDKESQQTIED